jgi:hypothetical protein
MIMATTNVGILVRVCTEIPPGGDVQKAAVALLARIIRNGSPIGWSSSVDPNSGVITLEPEVKHYAKT